MSARPYNRSREYRAFRAALRRRELARRLDAFAYRFNRLMGAR